MAAIYLRHPEHGQKVACGDQEAAYDRANGWVDFDPDQPAAPVVDVVVEASVEDAPALPSFLSAEPVAPTKGRRPKS